MASHTVRTFTVLPQVQSGQQTSRSLIAPWPPAVAGVYRIVDKKSGRFYIGSSVNVGKRWGQHRWRLEKGSHPNPVLQAIWNDDSERLSVVFVQACPPIKDMLLAIEQRHLDAARVGSNRMCMNVLAIAGSHLGRKRSEATKLAMSLAKIGKRTSLETRQKQRNAKLGRKLTEEHRRKIGKASKGRKGPTPSAESLAKYRVYSDEQVRELRRLVSNGMTVLGAAEMLGFSKSTAYRIITGASYVGV